MLSLKEAIAARRSVRSFRPDPVPEEMVQEMLEAARLAPSGSNRQPWRFALVTDLAARQKLREICFDQKFIEEAPVVFACFADLTTYNQESRRKRRQEFNAFGVTETLSGRFADPAYREYLDSLPDPPRAETIGPAIANTYIAIEHLVLTATALGLGTCWVGALGEPGAIERFFGVPDQTIPVAVIPVGYATKMPPQRPRLSMSEILLPSPGEKQRQA